MADFVLQEKVIASTSGGPDFATIDARNVLSDEAPPEPWTDRRVFWSGWMGDSIFARDFHTWSKEAWQRLDQWCDGIRPTLSTTGGTICFRPHARHILSDPQSCFSFLKRRHGQPVELLLDIAAFLTPAMLPRAEDHILRALDALADHDGVPGILISNVVRAAGDDDLLEPCPIDRGLLEPRLIQLISSRIPPGKATVLVDPVNQSQLDFLRNARR